MIENTAPGLNDRKHCSRDYESAKVVIDEHHTVCYGITLILISVINSVELFVLP